MNPAPSCCHSRDCLALVSILRAPVILSGLPGDGSHARTCEPADHGSLASADQRAQNRSAHASNNRAFARPDAVVVDVVAGDRIRRAVGDVASAAIPVPIIVASAEIAVMVVTPLLSATE